MRSRNQVIEKIISNQRKTPREMIEPYVANGFFYMGAGQCNFKTCCLECGFQNVTYRLVKTIRPAQFICPEETDGEVIGTPTYIPEEIVELVICGRCGGQHFGEERPAAIKKLQESIMQEVRKEKEKKSES